MGSGAKPLLVAFNAIAHTQEYHWVLTSVLAVLTVFSRHSLVLVFLTDLRRRAEDAGVVLPGTMGLRTVLW